MRWSLEGTAGRIIVQKLEVYQSIWGMELRNPSLPERSIEESFAMIADAGFDGACMDPSVAEIPQCREYSHLFGDGVMPIKPEDAVSDVRRWIGEASDRDMPLLFETHRDGLLNDLFFTLQLMDLVPEMRLCADLSHFVVDRELRSPITERDQGYLSSVLQRSDCFQGRIANREQVQIQINFPQHQEWVEIFKGWWKEGMREWRKRNDDDATLVFLCELGPPPYAITDADQNEENNYSNGCICAHGWQRSTLQG